MTDRKVKIELDEALRLLHENADRHVDKANQPFDHNLNLALLHMCRALEKIADQIHTIESQG